MQRCPFQLRLLFQRRHWSRLSLYWWTCTLAIAASISYVGYLEVSSDSDRQSEALNQYINHIDDVPDQLVLQSINREEISSSETQYSSKSTFALNAFQICNFSIADQACYLCCFQKIVACRCKEILSFLGTWKLFSNEQIELKNGLDLYLSALTSALTQACSSWETHKMALPIRQSSRRP